MSENAHHEDAQHGRHEGPIKTPKQLIIAVVLSFVVPIVAIVLLVQYVVADAQPAAGSDAMKPESVARRIEPAGRVEVQDASNPASPKTGEPVSPVAAAPAAAPAAPAPATTPVAAAAKADAGAVPALYTQACAVCHVAGVAGAPKIGDKAAWAPRLALGVDGLTASVITGKNAMPPRGGSTASDADIKAVVAYMVATAK